MSDVAREERARVAGKALAAIEAFLDARMESDLSDDRFRRLHAEAKVGAASMREVLRDMEQRLAEDLEG